MGSVELNEPRIVIPYRPRPLQRTIHQALDGYRFCVAVCHRRFGKTVLAVNHLQRCAVTLERERPRFAYIAPYRNQAKDLAWTYLKHYAAPIPGITVNESELWVGYPNGGQVRIYGADNEDALRGIYLDGIVLDEYGLMSKTIWGEVIRPLLSDREGWAFFIGTPNGRNQFYEIAQYAQRTDGWCFIEYKASQTGVLPQRELDDARRTMTADQYAQEYECSFEASVKGAVFAREMMAAQEDGRLTRVPYDPMIAVDTDWDLGMGDATAIVFSQSLPTREVRVIDYYENSGYGLQHYKQVLNDKGYTYGLHWAPHDVQVKELGTGRSRLEAAYALGLNFQVSPKVDSLDDGIHAARMLLPRVWFDATKAARLIDCLKNYRWAEPKTQNPTGRPLPVHDEFSHGADAFRGLAYRHYTPKRKPEAESMKAVRAAQIDRNEKWVWNPPRKPRAGM